SRPSGPRSRRSPDPSRPPTRPRRRPDGQGPRPGPPDGRGAHPYGISFASTDLVRFSHLSQGDHHGTTRYDKRSRGPRCRQPSRSDHGRAGRASGGAGVGAAVGGASAGAAAGAAAGPVGTVAGAVVGGAAGGYAGKGIAESIAPTAEDAYWRENYANRSYCDQSHSYDNDYAPAYRYGWESRSRYHDRTWDQAESDLQKSWEK